MFVTQSSFHKGIFDFQPGLIFLKFYFKNRTVLPFIKEMRSCMRSVFYGNIIFTMFSQEHYFPHFREDKCYIFIQYLSN